MDNESNKISKNVVSKLRLKLRELLSISCKKGLEIANLKGRLQERTQTEKIIKSVSYAEKLKNPAPAQQWIRVGRKPVQPKDVENIVLIYSKEETVVSEDTKKIVKQAIVPKEQGLKIQPLRKINKGGVLIESGNKQSAVKSREVAQKVETIKVATPRRILPKIKIFDVDRELEDAEIKEFIYAQKSGGCRSNGRRNEERV